MSSRLQDKRFYFISDVSAEMIFIPDLHRIPIVFKSMGSANTLKMVCWHLLVGGRERGGWPLKEVCAHFVLAFGHSF